MDYQTIGAWGVIKRFLLGWAVTGVLLVMVSCAIHWDFIVKAFADNTWALFQAVMPIIIILMGILYTIRAAFK